MNKNEAELILVNYLGNGSPAQYQDILEATKIGSFYRPYATIATVYSIREKSLVAVDSFRYEINEDIVLNFWELQKRLDRGNGIIDPSLLPEFSLGLTPSSHDKRTYGESGDCGC